MGKWVGRALSQWEQFHVCWSPHPGLWANRPTSQGGPRSGCKEACVETDRSALGLGPGGPGWSCHEPCLPLEWGGV